MELAHLEVKMARKKRDFGDGPIFTITNYIYWLFMGNLFFLLCNIPLVVVSLSTISNANSKFADQLNNLLFLCLIPIGPAATALFSAMGKLVREKSVNITRDYFKAYKTNFIQALFLWTMELLVLRILFIDFNIFRSRNFPKISFIVLYILIAIVFLGGLYMLPIISRFYLKALDIVKISIKYTVKKPHITVLNLVSILAVGFVFFKISSAILLFFSSIICYLIMFYENKILEELEESYK
jgi:uncharacterized membrane protein YesL